MSVNSGAIKNPELILSAAKKYGDQCVVLSMDVKRVGGAYHVFAKGDVRTRGLNALKWAEFGQEKRSRRNRFKQHRHGRSKKWV